MKAIILSSGEGTRLRPVTCTMPVSMLPVMGRPLIEHTTKLLVRHGINDITVAADYLSKKIKHHFSKIKYDNLKLSFIPLNDIGNIFENEDTLIISDNILTDTDLSEFMMHFEESRFPMIITGAFSDPGEYGCVHTDSFGKVTKYNRCPDFSYPSGNSFSGIAIIPQGTEISDFKDLPSLIEKLHDVYTYSPSCYIKSINDIDSYLRCCRDFMDKKVSLPFPCDEKAPSVWIEEDATVMQGSVIVPPVYIGSGSLISKGSRIEAYSQIGKDVTVNCLAGTKRSIIMDNSTLGEGSSIRGAIISPHCEIGYESAVYEGGVLGYGTKTGKHCTVRSGVHIWPEKFIEDEATISENIIWENTSSRSLFEDGCIYGIINREITPEFACLLGRSFASVSGKKIAVSEDGSYCSSMIKNALISGIQSAGCKAYDLGEQPLPITRSAVRFYSLDGGIALSLREHEGDIYGCLDIINSSGANIETALLKKLERLCGSGESKRASAAYIPSPEYLFEYKLYYLKQLINSTSGKPLHAKLLINCSNLWAIDLLKSAAKDLDCLFTFTSLADKEFSHELSQGDYDFGVMCDYKCETLTIVLNSGKKLSEFDYFALCALIIMKDFPHAAVFIPESAPDSVELMAKKYGASVHRSRVSPPYLMNELSKSSRKLFLHQFIYRFDTVGAIILLLDFLRNHNTTIEALLSEIPATHTFTSGISCSGLKQSEILKEVCHKHSIEPDEEKDTIRLTFENGWVLLVPKRSDSVINVISHASSKEYAQEISDIFTDEITKIIK